MESSVRYSVAALQNLSCEPIDGMHEPLSSTPAATEKVDSQTQPIGRILLVTGGLFVLLLLGRQAGAYVPMFAAWVDGLGVWGPIVFMVGYLVATVAFVPGSFLTLSAGAVFGLVEGFVYVFVAASLGAVTAFLVSRHVARASIEQKLAGNRRFKAIDAAVGGEGLKIVLLLRLSPALPFNLLNYGLGLTKVRLRDYTIACLGMIPGTMLYIYYGKLAGDVAQIATGGAVGRDAGYFAVLLLGLLASILVATLVARTARRALREATGT